MDAAIEAQLESQPEKKEELESAEQAFAAWRNRHTRGKSQGSSPDEPAEKVFEAAHEEGEEAARETLQQNSTLEALGEVEPTVKDAGLDVGPGLDLGPDQSGDAAAEGSSSSSSSSTADQQEQQLRKN
jgi:hypothetical protein